MSTFASYYYPPDIPSRRTRVPRNDDGGEGSSLNPPLSIFNYTGRPSGKDITSTLDNRDKKAAQLYVLLNFPEVVPYLNMYSNLLRELDPNINDADVDRQISTTLPTWFKKYVLDLTNGIGDMLLMSLAWGPLRNVTMWPSYVINGYKFVTKYQNEWMGTMNYVVCVRAGQCDTMENDYYGVLADIVKLEYTASPTKSPLLGTTSYAIASPQLGSRDIDGRIWIHPGLHNNFDPHSATRDVIKIIKGKFKGFYETYGEAKKKDEQMVNMWYGEFKRKYKWLPENERQVKKAFDHKASDGLSNAMYRIRNKIDDGSWIPPEIRDQLEQKWSQEDWKAKE
ncbi:hypothetical protein SESBI_04204 [Sesbania bispinosa]|nr:hypothetical protein SESBI_04204 [Sesbania bispinosa]